MKRYIVPVRFARLGVEDERECVRVSVLGAGLLPPSVLFLQNNASAVARAMDLQQQFFSAFSLEGKPNCTGFAGYVLARS